jgi:hypothetical protein
MDSGRMMAHRKVRVRLALCVAMALLSLIAACGGSGGWRCFNSWPFTTHGHVPDGGFAAQNLFD